MAAGILAQAAARHARLPGIVVLLAIGVLFGPDVANIVRPDTLGSHGLHSVVGFAVAIILFEGGLHMNIKKLRAQAKPIRQLVTVGAVVTAIGAAIAAKVFMGWDWRLSVLFGTLVIVTGPTVITPLLRRLRMTQSVSTILEAEGIFIDAVGATIAVVALEALLVPSGKSAALGIFNVAMTIGVGALVGAAGGIVLALLLRRRNVIPQGLENVLSLAFAVLVFQGSNALAHESGITAAIVAGMFLSNTRSHAFGEIVEFKEQLVTLLIATLFVLLAADVRVDGVLALGKPGVLTVAALMFVVRPLTVLASTWRTAVPLNERIFLSWLAPRGIVAAAVASLFAITLADEGIAGGEQMRALVFLVIAATVTLQGLTGGPLASLLGLRRPRNYGYVILGANALARAVGHQLKENGEPIVLLDSNAEACRVARNEGFEVISGNGLEDRIFMRAQADSRRACIALTMNESVNLLFARKLNDRFKGLGTVVAIEAEDGGVTEDMVADLHAGVMFGGARGLGVWLRLLSEDLVQIERWVYEVPGDGAPNYAGAPRDTMLPLAAVGGKVAIPLTDHHKPQKNDALVAAIVPDRRREAYDWLRDNGYVPTAAAEESAAPESESESESDAESEAV